MAALLVSVVPGRADIHYVAAAGANQAPYTSWSNAATDVQSAVNAAEDDDTVRVAEGVYAATVAVDIAKGILVQSMAGPSQTTIEAGMTDRCIVMRHRDAVLDGLTLRGGRVHASGGERTYPSGSGGGALIEGGGRMINCIVSQNEADNGGGVFLYLGGTIERCAVSGNTAANGAGIACWSGGLIMESAISRNAAVMFGGGVAIDGNVTISRSVMASNTAEMGGGLFALRGQAYLENCLVAANSALQSGGGVAVENVVLRNCSIGGNHAGVRGGGFVCASTALVRNAIIHGNQAPQAPDCADDQPGSDYAFSCVLPAMPGVGNITNDPRFVNAAAGDFHLAPGSPCIDAGTAEGAPDRDLEGVPRPLDGDAEGAAEIDMGAYEFFVGESNTRYVSRTGSRRAPFTNWMTAARDIQSAVDAAGGGETVLVANGVFTLTSAIAVATNLVVRSANGAASTWVDGGHTTRCFRLSPDAGCLLRGFTITNGLAADDRGGGVWMGPGNVLEECVVAACTARYGGAVHATMSTVSNCTLAGNAASLAGGGVFGDGVSLFNCAFERNSAPLGGGAIETRSDTIPVMRDCVFRGNTASAGGGVCCGTLTNLSVAMTTVVPCLLAMTNRVPPPIVMPPSLASTGPPLSDQFSDGRRLEVPAPPLDSPGQGFLRCIMVSNTAETCGGGLMLLETPALITSNCLFEGNRAQAGGGLCAVNGGELSDGALIGNGSDGLGGGALIVGDSRVRSCYVVSNHAGIAGGGIALAAFASLSVTSVIANVTTEYDTALPRVEQSRLFGNATDRAGGGAFCVDGGRLHASWVNANTAADGGGVYCLAGGRLVNDTITGNVALNAAGGLCVVTATAGIPSFEGDADIRNTIIYDNAATRAENLLNLGTNVNYTCCCTLPAPEAGGPGNITNSPLLTPAGRLKRDSPCIDAGTDGDAPSADLDGENRWDHPGHSNAVSMVDIGADEFVDGDLDGMADGWERRWFGSVTNADGTADADGDHLIDLGEYEHGTEPMNGDTDADQMPDGWEVHRLLNPLADDAAGDPDFDTMSNLGEYISDTDPHDVQSVLALVHVGYEWGGTRLDWKGGREALQILECRGDPASTTESWTAIFALPPPTGVTNAVIDMGATNRMLIYRLRAER